MSALAELRAGGFVSVSLPLSRGMWATIDIEDAGRILEHQWFAVTFPTARTFYAARNFRRRDGTRRSLYIHTAITGFKHVDHADGNGLNNRRDNLRESSKQQNAHNERHLRRSNTSGFKGVSFHVRTQKWQAKINVNRKRIYLGYFETPTEAAKAYDGAARKYFGEFAATNAELAERKA